MTHASPVRCGRISYTNDLPVYAAFDLGALPFPGTLREGVPTQLNRALLSGELDISPVSSFFYYQHQDALTALPHVCIGSRREVKSIYCISRRHPRELAGTRIAVTRESSTGRALFETICATWFGFSPTYSESDEPFEAYRADGTPCLVIGDAAIDAALAVPQGHAHDVGLLWHEHTGENMVYALWAARNDFLDQRHADVTAIGRSLLESVRWSEAHADRVIARAQEMRRRPPEFYEAYYQTLNYHLDEPANKGLALFVLLASKLGLLEVPTSAGTQRIRLVNA